MSHHARLIIIFVETGFHSVAWAVLELLGSSNPPALDSQGTGIIGGTGFHHLGQASLELPTSGDPPSLASQSSGITGMSHRAWPDGVSLCHPGWSEIVWSWLITTSASWVQTILLPQPPKDAFRHDGQAGLELLTSGDPPSPHSASQSVGITGVYVSRSWSAMEQSRLTATSAPRVQAKGLDKIPALGHSLVVRGKNQRTDLKLNIARWQEPNSGGEG
ncbi:hypothetical protein AAY473_030984 [Plecturocebus cupreus]